MMNNTNYNREEAARLYQKALNTRIKRNGQWVLPTDAAQEADRMRELIERHGG